MSVYKRGAIIRILLDEFTQGEWDAIWPFESVKCEANLENDLNLLEYSFSAVSDDVTKTIVLTSVSADEWPEGNYRLDVRFTKGGEHIYVPATDYIKFKIIRPVTDNEVTP